MTLVPTSKLKPNPYRNEDLYPIDSEQIEKLKRSVKTHGFLGGVKARPDPVNNGYFQIACGHHRIEATKQAGMREVDIVVGDMTDDEMIRLMTMENATQRGALAGPIINEVAAATERLAQMLTADDERSQICDRSLFEGHGTYAKAKQELLNGSGIGEKLIRRYLGNGDEKQCPRSHGQIRDAIVAFKESGLYADTIARAAPDIIADNNEADEAEIETEEDDSTELAPAGQRKKKKKKNRPPSRANRILDERCSAIFANDHQFAAFREAVTSRNGRRFISVNQQLALAKDMMRVLTRMSREGRRVGAPYIKSYIAGKIQEAVEQQRQIDQEERDRIHREQAEEEWNSLTQNMRSGLSSIYSAATKMQALLRQNPGLVHSTRGAAAVDRVFERMDKTIKALQNLRSAIQGATR